MIPMMVEKDYSPKCVFPHCVLMVLLSLAAWWCADTFVHAQRLAGPDPRHADVVSDVGC